MKTQFTALTLALIFISANALPKTDIGGAVSTDTTWTKEGSPFFVVHTIEIPKNVILQIEPGVKISFSPDTNLLVFGTLKAVGTKKNPIVFTSSLPTPRPGSWGQIQLKNQESQTPSPTDSILSHCEISYGQGIFILGMSPTISQCTILGTGHRSSRRTNAAIRVRRGSPVIRNNKILGNRGGAIRLEGSSNVRIENNDMRGNHGTVVSIQNCRDIVIKGNAIVGNTSSAISATYGGGSLTIEHNSLIGNGGTAISINARSGVISITHNAIVGNALQARKRHSIGGIRLDRNNAAKIDLSHNRISGNGGVGLWVADQNINIYQNDLSGNTSFAVRVGGGDIAAQSNWWGVAEALSIHQILYDFYDSQQVGRVLFEPFLTKPPTDIPPMPDFKVAVNQPQPVVQKSTAKKTGWLDALLNFSLPDLNKLLGGLLKDMLGLNFLPYIKNIWVWLLLLVAGGWIVRKLITEILIKPFVAGLKWLGVFAFRGIKRGGGSAFKGLKRGAARSKETAKKRYAAYQNRRRIKRQKSKTQESEVS